MAPPITNPPDRPVEQTPPGGPVAAVPQVGPPSFRWLQPKMFGVNSWNDLVRELPTQFQQAFWDSLVRFDTPQGAKNASRGQTGRFIAEQLLEKAKTVTAPPATDTTTPPPAADPNAYSQDEIDAINNPSKPESRTEQAVQPKTGDTRQGPNGLEVYVNGAWRLQRTNAGPQTPYTGSGDTATPNIDANPTITPTPLTPTADPFNQDRGVAGVPVTNYFTNPNVRPSVAAKQGNEWYWDATAGRWMQRISYQPSMTAGSPSIAKVTAGHTYGGYNYLFDPLRQRYVRAGKADGRGVQFASNATTPQFLTAAQWNQLMGGGTSGVPATGGVAKVPYRGSGV